jgi:tetratricopeptide (TPR) repeat protein
MTADTTYPSGRRMDCDRVMREQILEAYLVGQLTEGDRDAFEEHYFECARCFRDLQTLRAVQGELQRAGAGSDARITRPLMGWASAAALAAVVVLATSVVLWMRTQPPTGPVRSARTQPQVEAQPTDRPGPARRAEPAVSPEPTLAQLARVEPAPYEPLTLRGAQGEATTRFQRGMERYRQADYRGAIPDLSTAAESDPAAAHIRFFLGVSHLLLGQDRAAITWLQATIAVGDSAYVEDAHFYLAKAYLRRDDLSAAEKHLKRVVQLRESRSGEARHLLTQLARLKNPRK